VQWYLALGKVGSKLSGVCFRKGTQNLGYSDCPPLGMEKHNEVLEAVRPQILKLTKVRKKLIALEMLAALLMITALYVLIF
jgi:hypothetical protein